MEILARAEKMHCSPLKLVEGIYDGEISDIKPPIRRKIASFVVTMRALRALAILGENPGAMIEELLEHIGYQEHLKQYYDDWEARWENVEELINFASDFQHEPPPIPPTPAQETAEAMISAETSSGAVDKCVYHS